jgi:hypothetical protein
MQTALVAVMVTTGASCSLDDGIAVVTGVMGRDAAVELTREFVLVRAVPDHRDGFEVRRDYHGDLFFEDECPTDHLEFPFAYMLLGDQTHVDKTSGARWRLLVWETDDPDATWVEPGEAYGTAAFRFAKDAYGSWAQVDIVIDRIAR